MVAVLIIINMTRNVCIMNSTMATQHTRGPHADVGRASLRTSPGPVAEADVFLFINRSCIVPMTLIRVT